MAERHGAEPEEDAGAGVEQGEAGIARAQQVEALEAEGGKGGEATEKADEDETADRRVDIEPLVPESGQEPDRQATDEIDRQGADWKPRQPACAVGGSGCEPRLEAGLEQVARDRAERSAERDREQGPHGEAAYQLEFIAVSDETKGPQKKAEAEVVAPVAPPSGLRPGRVDPALLERLRAAAEILEAIEANRGLLAGVPEADRQRLLRASRQVSHPDSRARRRLVKATARLRRSELVGRDENLLAATGIRELRRKPVFTSPNVFPPADFVARDIELDGAEALLLPGGDPAGADAPALLESRHCYVCKEHYRAVHHFYDQLCPDCGEFNFAKRTETADLRGRVALLTGGRVKIGYQAGLKLLRAGARLIVTTRFPRDSAERYSREPDFPDWSDRLEIFGLDLRHTPSVDAFCSVLLERGVRLDHIVNNACQTVRRPPEFYRHMMERESAAHETLSESQRRLLGSYEGLRRERILPEAAHSAALEGRPAAEAARSRAVGLLHAAELSQVALLAEDHVDDGELFPEGRLDQDLQQIDLRGRNSWRLRLDEVSAVELLEVQLVNAVAPFLLNGRLKPLLVQTPERDKHVVNVSAVEGQFYRNQKTTRHPHTNMAKAALNMMTRTAAADYHQDGIHMNSVDTGWVTDEDPASIAARKVAEHRFHPPLDIVDGAARIVDPILDGANRGVHLWGKFLKDFRPTDW